MGARVLHVLAQRPLQTGSGVTLDALVRQAARAGWDQWVAVGTPCEDPRPSVGGLPQERMAPLRFGTGALDFAVPGMSDVMPYASTRFADMTEPQLRAYRQAWTAHLTELCASVRPDLIHVHHVWLVSALLVGVAPAIPVVNHCHATGLRQMVLCPELGEQVRRGCRGHARFLVLHRGDAEQLRLALGVAPERVRIVGAGYREELFHPRGRATVDAGEIAYVGKLSRAKGLPWLLDAMDRLALEARVSGGRSAGPLGRVRLHVAGGGTGREAEALRERMARMAPQVVAHGALTQPELAERLRASAVCVLPSFYEGLPLVLVEARACGCELVATALPGVVSELAPRLGEALTLVSLPRLVGVDAPAPAAGPSFVDGLAAGIRCALRRAQDRGARAPRAALGPFTWGAVFRRVEAVWREVLR